jgi:hypothetical protein
VTPSRRLGHGNAVTTLRIDSHAFDRGDEAAPSTIDALSAKGAAWGSGANSVPFSLLRAILFFETPCSAPTEVHVLQWLRPRP